MKPTEAQRKEITGKRKDYNKLVLRLKTAKNPTAIRALKGRADEKAKELTELLKKFA